MTPVLFLWTHDLTLLLIVTAINGFFSLGQYSWMPVWLPELFPTRMRATGIAFAFNAPRFIAFLGPLLAGQTDRAVRRLRAGGDDHLVHLHRGVLRGAVPAGDEGPAAAGECVSQASQTMRPHRHPEGLAPLGRASKDDGR